MKQTLIALVAVAPGVLGGYSRTRRATVCGGVGYDDGTDSYNNNNMATYSKCLASCQNDSKNCKSFSYGNGECNLYDVAVLGNFESDSSSPYTFYDISCASAASTTSRTTSKKTTTTTASVCVTSSSKSATSMTSSSKVTTSSAITTSSKSTITISSSKPMSSSTMTSTISNSSSSKSKSASSTTIATSSKSFTIVTSTSSTPLTIKSKFKASSSAVAGTSSKSTSSSTLKKSTTSKKSTTLKKSATSLTSFSTASATTSSSSPTSTPPCPFAGWNVYNFQFFNSSHNLDCAGSDHDNDLCYTGKPTQPDGYGPADTVSATVDSIGGCYQSNPGSVPLRSIGDNVVRCGGSSDQFEFYGNSNSAKSIATFNVHNPVGCPDGSSYYASGTVQFEMDCIYDSFKNATCTIANGSVLVPMTAFYTTQN